jgi:hypothetical protein
MAQFTSQYGEALLKAHQPNQWAFLCEEVGLVRDEKSVRLLDQGYGELSRNGYVIQDPEQKAPLYPGCVPRHLFQITDAGILARGPMKKQA